MNAEKLYYKTEKKFISRTLRGAMLELAARQDCESDKLLDPTVIFSQTGKYIDNGREVGYVYSTKYDEAQQARTYTISKIDTEALPFMNLDHHIQATLIDQLQNPDSTCAADTNYYLNLINLLREPIDPDEEGKDDTAGFVLLYRRAIETVYIADEVTFDITKQMKITHLIQNDILSSMTLGSHDSHIDAPSENEPLTPEQLAMLVGADSSVSTLELEELKDIRNCLRFLGLDNS